MSYWQDVENELNNLQKELEEHHRQVLLTLSRSAKSIDVAVGDHGAENWHEGFDQGYNAGFKMALKKGKLDTDDYNHYMQKAKDNVLHPKETIKATA